MYGESLAGGQDFPTHASRGCDIIQSDLKVLTQHLLK